jgi:aspartate ammonia-lyase
VPLVYSNPSISTALVPYVGYHRAVVLAAEMKNSRCTIFEANAELNLIDNELLFELMQPQNLLKLGYAMDNVVKVGKGNGQ